MSNVRQKKLLAGAVSFSLATLAIIGGTSAQFTDQTSPPAQSLTTGTIQVEIEEDTGWTDSIGPLAITDSARRSVYLDNQSSLTVQSLTLTAEVLNGAAPLTGRLAEAITIDITQITPGLGLSTLADDVPLSELTQGYPLTLPSGGLEPHMGTRLDFSYYVRGAPANETGTRTRGERTETSNPDNKYQASSTSIQYTLTALQRPGKTSDDLGVTSGPRLSLTASTNATTVNLTWQEVPHAVAYVVERSPNRSFESGPMVGVSFPMTPTFEDTNVSSGTTYYYRVVAHREGLPTLSSNTVKVTTP